MAQGLKNPPATQETQERQVQSLVQKDPLEEGRVTPSSILAWRSPWTEENLLGYSLKSHRELDTAEHEHATVDSASEDL